MAGILRGLLYAGTSTKDDQVSEHGGSFSMDLAEQDTFDGKVIDLDPIVREQLLLALPNVKGSALTIRSDALYLQFRRGRLTGWKGDWGTAKPPFVGW